MTYKTYDQGKSPAFTLIEMVITVAIVGLMLIIGMMAWKNQQNKARDAQRKDDLQRIKTAFEEYFSDFGCYPPETVLDNCGAGDRAPAGLMPYLQKIPCDPVTGDPYDYVPDADHPTCPKNFRIFGRLGNESDPVIANLNCAGEAGCGWGGTPAYNYGVASTNVTVSNPALPQASASPSPAPSASPRIYYYWCSGVGNCTSYDPQLWDCQPNYTDPNCGAQGGQICPTAGSCTKI